MVSLAGGAEFAIAGRRIGASTPPYLIAELSGNHNGRIERALELVDAAADAGADAVKLQTYTADTITLDCDRPEFRIESGLWAGRTLYDLYQEASTPWDWHGRLFERAAARGLAAFSSPFDPTAVDFLAGLDAPAYKIASLEIVDTPLIAHAATQGRPLIISTGTANLGEIERAVDAARRQGAPVSLLHCVTCYPAAAEDSNIRTIPHLAATFGCPAGLSDHTRGHAVAVAAVALGAAIVEKHITLRRSDGGPDADFSLEPDEFAILAAACREAWVSLGAVSYAPLEAEKAAIAFRRSLYVVADVAEGEVLTTENVRSIRPGLGLEPAQLPEVLGKRARRDLARGEPLSVDMVDAG